LAKSMRIRATDELAIARLIGECRDLGADAPAWQARLVVGLQRLTGGLVAGVGAMPVGVPAAESAGEYAAGLIDGGWPSDAARERFRTRRELVPDDDWDRSEFVNEELRSRGLDEGMMARCPTAAGPAYLVTSMRARRERPFDHRAGRLVGRLLVELTPHLGRTMWLTTQPHLGGLSPRRRRVLDCLLEGDGEKQVARRLGLHQATVHDHVKAIYLHFGVSSRPELMAVFLRRTLTPDP